MKKYVGLRLQTGIVVTVDHAPPKLMIETNAELACRIDLRQHYPSNFEWGYEGSGPKQLALSILCDLTGDDKFALAHYEVFKRYTSALWPAIGFALSEIDAWKICVRHLGSEKQARRLCTLRACELGIDMNSDAEDTSLGGHFYRLTRRPKRRQVEDFYLDVNELDSLRRQ